MPAAPRDAAAPLLLVEQLGYTYPDAATPALQGIDLAIAEGELLVLAGPAGGGKSTLLYALTGLIPHFFRDGSLSGSVQVRGKQVMSTPLLELAHEFGAVYQDPNAQLFGLNVEDAVAFGLENASVERAAIHDRVDETLAALDLDRLRGRSTQSLSGGERQATAIASVVAMSPPVVVLDEPLSALDPRGRALVQQVIRRLRDGGSTILVADQDLENWIELADRLVVLKDGGILYDGALNEYLADPRRAGDADLVLPDTVRVRHALEAAGRPAFGGSLPQVVAVASNGKHNVQAEGATTGAPLVELRDVGFSYVGRPVLDRLDLTLSAGQRVGLIGHNGSGKSTLAKLIAGLLRPRAGSVTVDGADLRGLPPSKIVRRVAYLFQNPSRMFLTRSVRDEVLFSLRGRPDAEQQADAWLARFELGHRADAVPALLSEGEKQRLALACVLALDPGVVILDEPTLGQSRSDRERLTGLMRELSDEGRLVLLISHDLRLVAEAADWLVVMEGGRVQADGPTREVLYDDALFERIAIPRPALVDLARAAGRPGVLTVDELLGGQE